jgi:CheY-like chemotaxis protein
VTQPLALLFYEALMPGSQLVNRLTDLGYRVQTVQVAASVHEMVRREKPLVLVADLVLRHGDFCGVIAELKQDPETRHVPVLGFTDLRNQILVEAAVKAGAKLVADGSGILEQLPQLLDHVLAVE